MHFKNWFFSRFLLVFYLAFWVKIFMLEIIKTVLFLLVYVFLDWLDHFICTSFCTLKTSDCISIEMIKWPMLRHWWHSRERNLVRRSHLKKGNGDFGIQVQLPRKPRDSTFTLTQGHSHYTASTLIFQNIFHCHSVPSICYNGIEKSIKVTV